MNLDFHRTIHAELRTIDGNEIPVHYGNLAQEYDWIHQSAGIVDLSYRSRLCLTGADRQRFIHGQVTNDVNKLQPGQGCYAALVTAKGKMVSDLNIHVLTDEILLDFEPGLSSVVAARLEKYIIADDVQILDVAPHYGLISIQGPTANDLVQSVLGPNNSELPSVAYGHRKIVHPDWGDVYLVNRRRTSSFGFDIYIPIAAMSAALSTAHDKARAAGTGFCGWEALETTRLEAAIPRFGADMEDTNLAPEAGLDSIAISYSKGCYIGQEVIARIRTYGQVAKALRGLRLSNDISVLPAKGEKLYKDDKEVGYITSAVASPILKANIALAYVRRETNEIGTALKLKSSASALESAAQIVTLPFQPFHTESI
jgi:folate-binding protein YgfZ